MKLYIVQATLTKTELSHTWNTQVPTFYLNAATQGIVDEDHAQTIVKDILNPFRDLTIEVNASIVAWYGPETPTIGRGNDNG